MNLALRMSPDTTQVCQNETLEEYVPKHASRKRGMKAGHSPIYVCGRPVSNVIFVRNSTARGLNARKK